MNNELYHYGVVGMKWGVRKDPSKAYARALRKKDKLEKRSARSAEVAEGHRKAAVKASKQIENLNAAMDKNKAKYYDAVAKKSQLKDVNEVPWWRTSERKSLSALHERYDKTIDSYNESTNKQLAAIGKLQVSLNENAKSYTRAKVRSDYDSRRLNKWTKSMNKAFADVDKNAIEVGKAMFEEAKNRNKKR